MPRRARCTSQAPRRPAPRRRARPSSSGRRSGPHAARRLAARPHASRPAAGRRPVRRRPPVLPAGRPRPRRDDSLALRSQLRGGGLVEDAELDRLSELVLVLPGHVPSGSTVTSSARSVVSRHRPATTSGACRFTYQPRRFQLRSHVTSTLCASPTRTKLSTLRPPTSGRTAARRTPNARGTPPGPRRIALPRLPGPQ